MQRCPDATGLGRASRLAAATVAVIDRGNKEQMVTNTDQQLSLCVEVRVDNAAWIEDLPPAPANRHITVSFDSARFVARDQRAVEQLGYTGVGVGAVSHVHDVAHLLVPLDAVHGHPRWWRALLDLAQRVYDLRFGPVQLALREVLATHHHGGSRNGRVAHRPATAPSRRRPTA
jgi:hypothetical protein